MRCANPDCRYLKRHGVPAEYRAGALTCSDCGGPLTDAPAASLLETSAAGHASLARAAGARLHPRAVRALIVTALVAALVPLASFVPLPYIDVDLVTDYLGRYGPLRAFPTQLSIVALGVAPWLTGALVVELVVALVPPWRSLRHGAARARLLRPALLVGLLIASVQARLLVQWLTSIWSNGQSIAPELYGTGPWLVVMLTLLAGACLARGAIALVETYGVGNGYAVVVVGGGVGALATRLVDTVVELRAEQVTPLVATFVFAGMAGVALLAWRALQPLDDNDASFVPRPSAGYMPAAIALLLPSTLAANLATLAIWFDIESDTLQFTDEMRYALAGVSLVVGIPLFARWFARDATRETRRAALPATVLLNVALVAFAIVAWRVGAGVDILFVVLAVAVARDVVTELAARRDDSAWVPLVAYARFTDAARTLATLETAGVHAVARGAHVRALTHVFAALTPIDVIVSESDVEKARAALP